VATRLELASFSFFPLNDNTNIPVIITNRHVIKNATEGTFQLTEANNNGTPNIGTFTTVQLDKFEGRWISHPNQDVDLCAMPIAPLLHEAKNKGKIFFSNLFQSYSPHFPLSLIAYLTDIPHYINT